MYHMCVCQYILFMLLSHGQRGLLAVLFKCIPQNLRENSVICIIHSYVFLCICIKVPEDLNLELKGQF